METTVVTALIALFGSVLGAILTFWFTKRKEREAEWRKEKLAYYKVFIESLSGVVEGDSSAEGHKRFAVATNNLLLFAPQAVITALNEFRHEIRVSNWRWCNITSFDVGSRVFDGWEQADGGTNEA